MKELGDSVLLDKLKQNDEAAFTELYNRYWGKMYVIALNRLNNPAEAEEAVQEVFYNIWKRRAEISVTLSLPAYLATAVKYEVLNTLARQKRFLRYEKYTVYTGAAADESAGEQLQVADMQRQLQQTIRALPEQCRLVYRLSREGGYSRKEIATTLDISEKTVANHLTRALKSLRGTFTEIFRILIIFLLTR
nr:RNA polymerase sigma-70 factor [uncultured Chitinophaga sp.]